MLCTQGYSGKGYSKDFVHNMDKIVHYLRNNIDSTVEIVFSTDDICDKCPSNMGSGKCDGDDKVLEIDRKVIEYFFLEEKIYSYHDLVEYIKNNINRDIMEDICSKCQWYPISSCKKNILAKKK